MCSSETEIRLGKLLMTLAEGERSIEISRQVLSDLKEYDSFQIFKNIDFEDKNKIDCYSLINFLRIKGIYCTEEEASLIILFYDQDYDNALSYQEFIKIIQSDKIVKESLNKSPKDKMPFNVEYSLSKLLEKEVELSRNIIYALQDIKCRYDFNIHNLFHSLKYFNSITGESLVIFLERNGISYLESDIKSIKKRLDLNKDGIIDFCEFHAFLGFPDCIYCCPCINCESCGQYLCNSCYSNLPCYSHGVIQNKINDINKEQIDNCYLMDHKINNNKYSTDFNKFPINLSYNKTFETSLHDVKETEGNNISKSLFPRTSPRRKYNTKYNYLNENENLNNIDIQQFNDFLVLLMKAETEIEKIKIELAKRDDFNCGVAFRIFEKDNNAYLSKEDLKEGLHLLELNVDDYVINLLFKRYDLLKQNELNYPYFFDMMIPFERIYRNNIEKRVQQSSSCEQSLKLLSEKTLKMMKNVFNIIIKYEEEINEERKKLSHLVKKLKDIFACFDINGIGYFRYGEFINYMKDNKLFDDKNLNSDLLFIRFDKNRNGKITFEEFIDEFESIY